MNDTTTADAGVICAAVPNATANMWFRTDDCTYPTKPGGECIFEMPINFDFIPEWAGTPCCYLEGCEEPATGAAVTTDHITIAVTHCNKEHHMLRAKELAEYRASTKIEDPDHWDELKNKW